MYKLFLCLRLLRKRRITYLPIAAVTLCSAMVLIVISVMGGFLDNVRQRSHGLLGDMILDNGSFQGFPRYQPFIDRIEKNPELKVKRATPVIFTFGLLRFDELGVEITRPVQVVGIRFDEKVAVTDFADGLFYAKHFPGIIDLKHTRKPLVGLAAGDRLPRFPAEWQEALAKGDAAGAASDPAAIGFSPLGLVDWKGLGVFQPNWEAGYEQDEAPLPGIIVGLDVSDYFASRDRKGDYTRHAPIGAKMLLTLLPLSITGEGKVSVDVTGAITKPFRYADDSRTGVFEIDSRSVYVDFERLQEYLGIHEERDADDPEKIWPGRCSQIQVDLDVDKDDRKGLEAIKKKMQAEWDAYAAGFNDRFMDSVQVQTWEETQAQFIAAVQKEKQLMIILFGIISLVAVVLVLCVFYMIVVEKTRDIGVIKSVGGSARGVAGIFLAYGAAVGIVGSIVGLLLGNLFVININGIHDWIAQRLGWEIWSRQVYTFDRIPDTVKGGDVVEIFVVAIVAAVFGAVIPAIRAARMHPVESLRYE